MKARPLFLTMLFLLMSTMSLPQIGSPLSARRGDIATGAVESETDTQLFLNTMACKTERGANIVIFHRPYRKNHLGDIQCGNRVFEKATVEQQ